jgi:hypothetical protein
MTICWPQASLIFAIRIRPAISLPLPGADPITIRTGL